MHTHTHSHRYGLYRSDQLIYSDPDLCFKETVPQSALFDPTTNQALQLDDKESGGSEDEEEGQGEPTEGAKAAKSSSNPVPLGWPKVQKNDFLGSSTSIVSICVAIRHDLNCAPCDLVRHVFLVLSKHFIIPLGEGHYYSSDKNSLCFPKQKMA